MNLDEKLCSICESVLRESSLSRLLYHGKNTGYIVVSACRHEHSAKENWKRTHNLKKDLDASEFSYIQSTGGYPEEGEDGDSVDVREHSFVVLPRSKTGELLAFDDLMNFGRFLCKKYGQESLLKTKEPENPKYIKTDGSTDMEFTDGAEYNTDSPYFTALGRHSMSNLHRKAGDFRDKMSFK